jgi:hypothetical protein
MNARPPEKALYPLLEGGVAAPTKQMERYLRFGAAGEVKQLVAVRF